MRRWPALALIVFQALVAAPVLGQTPAQFVTVDQGPEEFEGVQQLHLKLDMLVDDASPTEESYGSVVQRAIRNDDNPFLARMTPYVYVASEMQGAKLDLIGTYLSKSTKKTTYHSYLVVRRDAFTGIPDGAGPSLAQVVEWLHSNSLDKNPLRFLYHDRWSTSSYFLPSLYFRSQRIFAVSEQEANEGVDSDSDQPITAILLEDIASNSSSDLVRRVAGEEGTFAAVWDGTRSKFLDTPEGNQVYFVQIPGELPNDLLVASRSVEIGTKSGIEQILKASFQLGNSESDVDTWLHWLSSDARDARTALSVLRRRAATHPAPIVVDVRSDTGSSTVENNILEAVQQAVRLSGTELVVDDDYYARHNVEWVLTRVHDDALKLTATYKDFDLDGETVEQEFRLSYLDPSDLTRRVGMLIHDRMHRIRPLWLYQNTEPTVIRDVDFGVSTGEALPYQVIDWEDPESNNYKLFDRISTKVIREDFSKLTLENTSFPKTNDQKLNFEPMGRREYRVLLIRPSVERLLFKSLTVILVLLFVFAAVGAIWDLRRSATRVSPRQASM